MFYGLLGSMACSWGNGLLANDSEAGLVAGGLVYKSNPHISMMTEDLLISIPENKIRVEYTYKNNSDHDQELLIGFPIPTPLFDLDYDKDLPAYEQLDPSSEYVRDRGYTNFKTWVDGEIVSWWPLFQGSLEQQELCQDLWLKRNALYDEAGYCFKDFSARTIFDNSNCNNGQIALTAAQKSAIETIQKQETQLACKRALNFELYDAPPFQRANTEWLEDEHGFTTILRRQKFFANDTVKVVHEYEIDWGGGVPIHLATKLAKGINTNDWLKWEITCPLEKDRFIDKNLKEINERIDGISNKLPLLEWGFTTYILTTGKNWNGPIGRFRLEIITLPDQLLSVCSPNLKRVSETSYVFEADQYVPSSNVELWTYRLSDYEIKH